MDAWAVIHSKNGRKAGDPGIATMDAVQFSLPCLGLHFFMAYIKFYPIFFAPFESIYRARSLGPQIRRVLDDEAVDHHHQHRVC
jgi:hypothetical protein